MSVDKLKVLFIGESWQGSCARSLKEALSRRGDVQLDEIHEDAWFPQPSAKLLRVLNRAFSPVARRLFSAHVVAKVKALRPDVVMTYKGGPIHADLIESIARLGAFSVNVYPDCSPHAHGDAHRKAVGAYDLVISTKVFHSELWQSAYGYTNRCAFVPQGYDPMLHLVPTPPSEFAYDLVLVATYRAEYGRLMADLAKSLNDPSLRVAIGGKGWDACRTLLPTHWHYPGPVRGSDYIALLRKGKVCIAPLTRDLVINGRKQPGDVDTTRTYELAAANCFFLHQRTDFAMELYSPGEVAMFGDANELAGLVRRYLANDEDRSRMAAAAHLRAVPAYSLDARAEPIIAQIKRELAAHCSTGGRGADRQSPGNRTNRGWRRTDGGVG